MVEEGGRGRGRDSYKRGRGEHCKCDETCDCDDLPNLNDDSDEEDYKVTTKFARDVHIINTIMTPVFTDRPEKLISCQLMLQGKPVELAVLPDTGALSDNYCSERVAAMHRQYGKKITQSNGPMICSALDGQKCEQSLGRVEIDLRIFNEIKAKYEYIKFEAAIIKTKFDLIIGDDTMYDEEIISKIPSRFLKSHQYANLSPSGVHASKDNRTSLATLTGTIKSKEELFELSPDDDGMLGNSSAPWEDDLSATPDGFEMPNIYGKPAMKAKITSLVNEFRDVFSTKLRAKPADLPPMQLDIDHKEWFTSTNRTGPRLMSSDKEKDSLSILARLEGLGVIRRSDAAAYSHLLMVPKPLDAKTNAKREHRLVIDFRRLNLATRNESKYPIANISHMVRRIGEKKAKFYSTFDFNEGYWQIAMAEDSMRYTAFMTIIGIYEWCRIAMGLKGAGSYFQQMIQTIVLVGLLFVCCESYLDDVIQYGKGEEDYLASLKKVLTRFKKHGITCSPRKTHLGLET